VQTCLQIPRKCTNIHFESYFDAKGLGAVFSSIHSRYLWMDYLHPTGSVKVAWSMTVWRLNDTKSTQAPFWTTPRSTRLMCLAVIEVIFFMAFSKERYPNRNYQSSPVMEISIICSLYDQITIQRDSNPFPSFTQLS
jgi:hypothetical protein